MTKNSPGPGTAARPRLRPWALFATLGLLLVLGFVEIRWRGRSVDEQMRANLGLQARALARAIAPEQVEPLTFTSADQAQPTCLRIRQQLQAYQAVAGVRGIYTLARRGDDLVFGPESYDENDAQASPIGTIYEQPSRQTIGLFSTGQPFVEGPITDEYGTFVSAFAPIIEPHTGAVIAAVGLDLEAGDWQDAVRSAQLIDGAGVAGLILMAVLGAMLVWWRDRRAPSRSRLVKYTEAFIVAALGIGFSLVVSLLVGREQARAHQNSFAHVAELQAAQVVGNLRDVLDNEVEAVARLFEASNQVDEDEFGVFTSPMLRHGQLEWVAWSPAESGVGAEVAEEQVRAEVGQQHAPEPAPRIAFATACSRASHGASIALAGRDIPDRPAFRAALAASFSSGLTTCVNTGPGSDGQQPDLTAVRPVFAGRKVGTPVRGVVIAVIDANSLLSGTSPQLETSDHLTRVDLVQLAAGGEVSALASTAAEGGPAVMPRNTVARLAAAHETPAVVFPLFALDWTLAVIVRPAADMLAADPMQMEVASAVVGLAFTALLTSLATATVRRRTELESLVRLRTAEVRESEKRILAIADAAQDGIITIDSQGAISFWNDGAARIFGYTRQQVLGKHLHHLLAPARYHAAHAAAFAVFRETGTGQAVGRTVDLQAVRRDGQEFPIQLTLSALAINNEWHAVGIVRDVTEKIAQEEQLRLRGSALEAAANAVVITDVQGRILWVNPAFTRMTGYEPEEVLGRNPRLLKSDVHDASFYANMWETISAGEVWSAEMVNRRKDGTLYHEDATLTPIRDQDGRLTHFVAIKQDITDRRRAQRLADERDQLRKAAKAHEQVLGVVGHELRTPLAGLLIITELLQRSHDRASAEYDGFLTDAHDELERMSGLVNDLLEVARLNSGIPRWRWGQVELGRACSDAAASIAPMLASRPVRLSVDVQPRDLQMRGDDAAIRRLILNLLTNASKHTTEGSISVTARAVEDSTPAEVELRVADTGAGMSAETAAKLGEAFALNSGMVGGPNVTGSGLGVTICRGIISAHGGAMRVKSRVNEGTEIVVRLRADLDIPNTFEQMVEIATEVDG